MIKSNSLLSKPLVAKTQTRIWAIAWPVMLSNLSVPLIGLVDSAVLGHLPDATHLGAVALGAQLFTLLVWSLGFLRMGTTALSARSATVDSLQQVFLQGAGLALLISLPLMLLGSLGLPIVLKWMGASLPVIYQAELYLDIRLWSVPAVLLQYVILGWLIGQGSTRWVLLITLIGHGCNLILDIAFVHGLGMATGGVALGTLIADYVALMTGLWVISSQSVALPRLLLFRFQYSVLKPMLKVNGDLFLRTLLLMLAITFFNAQSAQQGTLILAANSLLMTLLLLVSNALDGFANAAESLIGRALVARNHQSVRLAMVLTGVNSLAMAMLLALVFLLANEPIWWLLTNHKELMSIIHEYQGYLFLLPLVGVGSYWLDGVCLAAGATHIMRNAMICSVFLCYLPVWWLTQEWGNAGLWLALYSFLLARVVFALPFLRRLYLRPDSYAPSD